MKKLQALLLLFGIVGCATTSENSYTEVSHQFSEQYDGILVESYEDLKVDSLQVRAEAMTTNDGRTYHRSQTGNQNLNKWRTKHVCEELYKVECVISREGSNIIYANYEDYKTDKKLKDIKNKEYLERLADLNAQAELEAIMTNSYYREEDCDLMLSARMEDYLKCKKHYDEVNKSRLSKRIEIAEELKEKEEEKRIAVIHALKDRCISYGFTGSNNVAACVQREAQHDYEIEQKDYQLQIAQYKLLVQQSQFSAQQSQPEVAPKIPWYLQALEAVAEGVAEGYKQQALIQTMDSRYEKKDIYRYCRPNC